MEQVEHITITIERRTIMSSQVRNRLEYLKKHNLLDKHGVSASFSNDLLEHLAELEHEQWAHWTEYMINNLTPKNIARWRRQIGTAYADLTEPEKESDRKWAQKVIDAL